MKKKKTIGKKQIYIEYTMQHRQQGRGEQVNAHDESKPGLQLQCQSEGKSGKY